MASMKDAAPEGYEYVGIRRDEYSRFHVIYKKIGVVEKVKIKGSIKSPDKKKPVVYDFMNNTATAAVRG